MKAFVVACLFLVNLCAAEVTVTCHELNKSVGHIEELMKKLPKHLKAIDASCTYIHNAENEVKVEHFTEQGYQKVLGHFVDALTSIHQHFSSSEGRLSLETLLILELTTTTEKLFVEKWETYQRTDGFELKFLGDFLQQYSRKLYLKDLEEINSKMQGDLQKKKQPESFSTLHEKDLGNFQTRYNAEKERIVNNQGFSDDFKNEFFAKPKAVLKMPTAQKLKGTAETLLKNLRGYLDKDSIINQPKMELSHKWKSLKSSFVQKCTDPNDQTPREDLKEWDNLAQDIMERDYYFYFKPIYKLVETFVSLESELYLDPGDKYAPVKKILRISEIITLLESSQNQKGHGVWYNTLLHLFASEFKTTLLERRVYDQYSQEFKNGIDRLYSFT